MENVIKLQRGTHSLIAPAGTADLERKHEGRCARKPREYNVTAAIPHLNTPGPLRIVIELLRLQTERPYIIVVDTGSSPENLAQLEAMRCEDVEIHYVAAHGYCHTSEPVAVALDLAQALCRTKYMFHTHSDLFLRRRDFLENVLRMTNANTPVVGYRMSPRDWATTEWEWMVGHAALMLYMPSIHRIGATWSMQRMHEAYDIPWDNKGGWPDTETGFNYVLRDHGVKPVFLGHDRNFERQVDDNIDHVRSYPGARLYSAHSGGHLEKAENWMRDAMKEAIERINLWRGFKPACQPPPCKPLYCS